MFRTMNETKQIEIEGVQFTIQVIKRKIFRKLTSELAQAKLEVAGFDEALTKEKLDQIQKEKPQEFFRATSKLSEVYFDFVRYGTLGHKDFKASNGQEIPFVKDGEAVSEETLDHYDLNGFILKLGTEVMAFNTLSEAERKNS